MVKCPAHDDRNPSLSVRDGEGRLLVHCHAGCTQAAVINALRINNLWPEGERREWTPAERRDYARARREAKPIARAALWWWRARLSELEDLKRGSFHGGGVNIDSLAAASSAVYRLQSLSADGIVAAYFHARAAEPHAARELVRIGKAWEAACKAVVMAVLTGERREAKHAA